MAVMIRNLVKDVYKSKTWNAKIDKMSDGQVFAIYIRLKAQGKI